MQDKHKRLVDKQAYEECTLDWCEWCGGPVNCGPHHIISRGAGGPDIKENLVQLCLKHHREAHNGKIPKRRLFMIVAMRMRIPVEEVISRIEEIVGRGIDNS